VSFATEDEIKKTMQAMNSKPQSEYVTVKRPKNLNLRLSLLIVMIAVSLLLTIWTLTQSPINLAIFVAAFLFAVMSSTILGVLIARK
jgi:K+-sensing histidine kinase KdpD